MLRGRLLVAGHRADQGRGRRSAENLFGCFLYGSAGSCHSVKDSDILHENWTLIRAVKSEQACCFDALATAICLFCHCPRRRVVAKNALLLCNVLQRSRECPSSAPIPFGLGLHSCTHATGYLRDLYHLDTAVLLGQNSLDYISAQIYLRTAM
jgi:hypothetical protein